MAEEKTTASESIKEKAKRAHALAREALGALAHIQDQEKEVLECAQREKEEKEKEEVRAAVGALEDIAPAFLKVRERCLNLMRIEACDPRMEKREVQIEQLLQIARKLFAEAEDFGKDAAAFWEFCENFKILERVRSAVTRSAVLYAARDMVREGYLKEVNAETYEEVRAENIRIYNEKKRRRDGKPHNPQLAKAHGVSYLEVRTKNDCGWFVASSPFGGKVVGELLGQLKGGSERKKSFFAHCKEMRKKDGAGSTEERQARLLAVLVEGAKGIVYAEGFLKPKARDAAGQQYAVLIEGDGEGHLSFPEIASFGRPDAEDLLAGCGGTYEFTPALGDSDIPNFRELPSYHLSRFLFHRLSEAGWEYPAGGGNGGAERFGTSLSAFLPKTRRGERADNGGGKRRGNGRERGGGNSRRYEDRF